MIEEFHDPRHLWTGAAHPDGMLVTDYDGTLRPADGRMAEADLAALRELAARGVVRAIATGRSLYSFRQSAPAGLPMDFIVFASGAGVVRLSDWTLIRRVCLSGEEVEAAAEALAALKLDYMIHRPIPEDHCFEYRRLKADNPDLERRLGIYQGFHQPLAGRPGAFSRATFVLSIAPGPDGVKMVERVRAALPELKVIRTTSPLDHQSTWIEIYPRAVSKGLTAGWLASCFGLGPEKAVSVGNDYNDLDILEWAGSSFVVDGAPDELKARFRSVAAAGRGGLAEAVSLWRAEPLPVQ